MLGQYEGQNATDKDGNPTGGSIRGVGLVIDWQNGPLGRDSDRVEPNGAFVETVIHAAKSRLEFYQASKYSCEENAEAIKNLEYALQVLDRRTKDRESRKVEGTHVV